MKNNENNLFFGNQSRNEYAYIARLNIPTNNTLNIDKNDFQKKKQEKKVKKFGFVIQVYYL